GLSAGDAEAAGGHDSEHQLDRGAERVGLVGGVVRDVEVRAGGADAVDQRRRGEKQHPRDLDLSGGYQYRDSGEATDPTATRGAGEDAATGGCGPVRDAGDQPAGAGGGGGASDRAAVISRSVYARI